MESAEDFKRFISEAMQHLEVTLQAEESNAEEICRLSEETAQTLTILYSEILEHSSGCLADNPNGSGGTVNSSQDTEVKDVSTLREWLAKFAESRRKVSDHQREELASKKTIKQTRQQQLSETKRYMDQLQEEIKQLEVRFDDHGPILLQLMKRASRLED